MWRHWIARNIEVIAAGVFYECTSSSLRHCYALRNIYLRQGNGLVMTNHNFCGMLAFTHTHVLNSMAASLNSTDVMLWKINYPSHMYVDAITYTTGRKNMEYILLMRFFKIWWGVHVFLYLKYIPSSKYYFWASYFALNSKIKHTGSKTITLVLFLY